MNGRVESLIKNTTILSFGMICTKGLTFLMTPLFTRWLSASDYGSFDLMVTYMSLLVPFFTLSIGEAVFRKILDESEERKKREICYCAFVICLIGSGVAGIIIMIYSVAFGKDVITLFLFWLFFCGEALFNFCTYLLRGLKKMQIYTIGNILYVVGLSIFSPIFILCFKMGVNGIIFGYFLGDVISILIMLKMGNLKFYLKKVNVKGSRVQEVLNYSLPMIPNAISWWIINVSDRTIISLFFGGALNAIYAISNKVPALCTTFFSVFHLSWQQSATETMTDKDRDYYYSSVMNSMFSIISSICIVVVSLNYFFFKLLFTDYYFIGMYQSPILVLAIVFSTLAQFLGGIYVAQMKSKKNGFTTTVAAIINLIVSLALIGRIGLYAASLSTLISYFVLFVIRYIDIKHTIDLCFTRRSIGIFLWLLVIICISYIQIMMIQALLVFISFVSFGFINKDIFFRLYKT